MRYITRSSIFNLRSGKVIRTPTYVPKRHLNICDDYHDVHKVAQMENLMRNLSLLDKEGRDIKALVLDSTIHRTSKTLKRHNISDITLVERDAKVAVKHRKSNFSVEEMTVMHHLKTTNNRYDLLYLDTESGSPDALAMYDKVLQGNVISDKCILFLNFSARGIMSRDGMELLGKGKGGLVMSEFWNHCSTLMNKSGLNAKLLYQGKYSRGRGAPMHFFALLLEK